MVESEDEEQDMSPKLRKASPTDSEIEVESRMIWFCALGNLETWIEVGLYGQALRRISVCPRSQVLPIDGLR